MGRGDIAREDVVLEWELASEHSSLEIARWRTRALEIEADLIQEYAATSSGHLGVSEISSESFSRFLVIFSRSYDKGSAALDPEMHTSLESALHAIAASAYEPRGFVALYDLAARNTVSQTIPVHITVHRDTARGLLPMSTLVLADSTMAEKTRTERLATLLAIRSDTDRLIRDKVSSGEELVLIAQVFGLDSSQRMHLEVLGWKIGDLGNLERWLLGYVADSSVHSGDVFVALFDLTDVDEDGLPRQIPIQFQATAMFS